MPAADPSPQQKSPLERLLADVQAPDFGMQSVDVSEGATFGDYKLIKELGSGGMGTVWEAEQQSIRRRVAVKILDAGLGLRTRDMERFHREAEAGARLEHPSIVTVFELGEVDNSPFIAQELIEGGRTLDDLFTDLAIAGELPNAHFRHMTELFVELADALQSAHDAGVTHRDLKPQNILITPSGEPRIADFGLAVVADGRDLARTGDFIGTPYYMSPEQAASKRMGMDHRTDIFSLGATFYEALTLARPFTGDSYPQIIKKVLVEDPAPPRSVRSQIPEDLAVICLKAMEKDADRRYPSMRDFAEDLQRFLEDRPIFASPPGWVTRTKKWVRRHPALALSGAIGGITLLISTWLLWDSAARIQAADVGRTQAQQDQRVAQQEQLIAEKTMDLVIAAFETADPSQSLGEDITMKEIYQQSLLLLQQDGELSNAMKARVRAELEKIQPQ
ncbi:MAG: serine/threonine-protein kinase [Planctomycetota bacterium]|nr:serine/threonine-protein kinase [Planctomycetota bacterium]